MYFLPHIYFYQYFTRIMWCSTYFTPYSLGYSKDSSLDLMIISRHETVKTDSKSLIEREPHTDSSKMYTCIDYWTPCGTMVANGHSFIDSKKDSPAVWQAIVNSEKAFFSKPGKLLCHLLLLMSSQCAIYSKWPILHCCASNKNNNTSYQSFITVHVCAWCIYRVNITMIASQSAYTVALQ